MFEKLFDKILKANSIVIFGHINPDCDCYGSQIALRECLKKSFPNKKVFATGSGMPKFFKHFGSMDIIDDITIKNSLAIIVDANDFSRLEDQRVSTAKEFIKIDHHVENGLFTQGEFVVNENSNSTCELILSFIEENALFIDSKIASLLYLGILTDTGSFQYVHNYVSLFEKMSKLCKIGANPKLINRILKQTDEDTIKLKGFYLSNYKKTKNGVIYVVVPKEKLEEFNIPVSRANEFINLLSNVKDCPVWCSFSEYPNGTTRCEFRSLDINVEEIAKTVGGGGHKNASGATLKTFNLDEILEIVEQIDQQIKELK